MATETKQILYNVRVNTANGKVKIDGLTRGFIDAGRASDLLRKKIADTNNELNKNINKTGLAGAAVTELGRTISDSNYGFTAMANNISQLGTLFATLVSTTKGVGNGLKAMGQALMGPLGVIVGFQIVIAVIERFSMESKKATEEANKLNDALGSADGQIYLLKQSAEIYKDATASSEKHRYAIQELKKNGYDPLIGSLEKFLEAKQKILIFDATKGVIVKELEEAFSEQRKIQNQIKELNETIAERKKILDDLRAAPAASYQPTTIGGLIDIGSLQSDLDNLDERKKSIIEKQNDLQGELKTELDKLTKELEGNPFFCLLFGNCGDNLKDIKIGQDFLDKLFEDQLRKILKKFDDRLKEQKKTVSVSEIISFTADDAETEIQVEESVEKLIKSVTDPLEEKLSRLDNVKEYLNISASLVDAFAQREITTEKNKTNALNNELKARLRNEQLSIDQRKGIQNQIAQNEEALRIKQEKIAKKKFYIDKAFRLSQAIIDVMSNSVKARLSQYSIPDVSAPARAEAAAKLETIRGYANIAVILAQKYQSSASAMTGGVANVSTGGGSSAGGTVQAPDFNIVGQSAQSQLAQTVAGQLAKPTKAYIVSKDVTTAQELDRNRINGASLG